MSSAHNGITVRASRSAAGGAGHDLLLGAEGSDTLFGNSGDDFLDGGPGIDTCHLGGGDDETRNCEREEGTDRGPVAARTIGIKEDYLQWRRWL
jgi:hypothetical protein